MAPEGTRILNFSVLSSLSPIDHLKSKAAVRCSTLPVWLSSWRCNGNVIHERLLNYCDATSILVILKLMILNRQKTVQNRTSNRARLGQDLQNGHSLSWSFIKRPKIELPIGLGQGKTCKIDDHFRGDPILTLPVKTSEGNACTSFHILSRKTSFWAWQQTDTRTNIEI